MFGIDLEKGGIPNDIEWAGRLYKIQAIITPGIF